jgi:hypothetical protein
MKAQRDESGGRVGLLLGDKADGGAGVLQPIKFQCDRVWVAAGLPCKLHTYAFDHMHSHFLLVPDLQESKDYASQRVSVFLVTSIAVCDIPLVILFMTRQP